MSELQAGNEPAAPVAPPPAASPDAASEPQAQNVFESADAQAESLFAKFQEETTASPEPEVEDAEPEPEVTEPETEEEPIAAKPEDEAEDPFKEFEPVKLPKADEIDAKFPRIAKSARDEMKQLATRVEELEAEVESAPGIPEHFAPIAEAINFELPETATPQDWAQVGTHADNVLNALQDNTPLLIETSRKLAAFAFENDPTLLDQQLQTRKGLSEAELDELIAFRDADVFDINLARQDLEDHKRSLNPALMTEMDKIRADNELLRTQMQQLVTGSQREKQAAAEKAVKEHESTIRTRIMSEKVQPMLQKLGWDKIDGFGEVFSAFAERELTSAPEYEKILDLAKKGQAVSAKAGEKETPYDKAMKALMNRIQARTVGQGRRIDTGLSSYKRPAIKSQSAAKETKEAITTTPPPIAKPTKPVSQMSADEVVEQLWKQAQAKGVRL